MLMKRDGKAVFFQGFGHFEGSGSVHVGRDDRNATVFHAAVAQCEGTGQIDIGAARKRGTFGADKNIFEVKLNFVFDMHWLDPFKPFFTIHFVIFRAADTFE